LPPSKRLPKVDYHGDSKKGVGPAVIQFEQSGRRIKSLFNPASVSELEGRLAALRPDSERLWGKMGAAEMLAHCSLGIEMACGSIRPKRVFIGRIIGPAIKRVALRDDEPMRRNSPTAKELLVIGDPEFEAERTRLSMLLKRLAQTGPSACTAHPHPFFGKLTPDEWAILMYKHLDHHLRQFGA
jgi:hypothetical protein